MKLVYIAGPFRGPTPWDVEHNVRRAEAIGLEVARAGHMPVIPHANTRFFDGQLTGEFWLAGTLELMRRCDMVLMVSGWAQSPGSREERYEAIRLGKQVYYDVSELPPVAPAEEHT
jgi:hypothetical protein